MTVESHGACLAPVWTSGEYHPGILLFVPTEGPTSVEVATGKAQEVRQVTGKAERGDVPQKSPPYRHVSCG